MGARICRRHNRRHVSCNDFELELRRFVFLGGVNDMTDKRRIKIGLTNDTGKHEFVYTPDQLNDLISSLIQYSLDVPALIPLEETVALSKNPITADRLMFQPVPESKTEMLLVVGAKAFELQFRVPNGDVFEILKRLEDETVQDPNSPQRH